MLHILLPPWSFRLSFLFSFLNWLVNLGGFIPSILNLLMLSAVKNKDSEKFFEISNLRSPTHKMLHFLAFLPYVIYIFSHFSLLFLEIHLIMGSHFHAWTKHFINSVLPLVTLLHAWFQALSQQSELTKYLLWSAQRDQCGGITICKQNVYLTSTIILTQPNENLETWGI